MSRQRLYFDHPFVRLCVHFVVLCLIVQQEFDCFFYVHKLWLFGNTFKPCKQTMGRLVGFVPVFQ